MENAVTESFQQYDDCCDSSPTNKNMRHGMAHLPPNGGDHALALVGARNQSADRGVKSRGPNTTPIRIFRLVFGHAGNGRPCDARCGGCFIRRLVIGGVEVDAHYCGSLFVPASLFARIRPILRQKTVTSKAETPGEVHVPGRQQAGFGAGLFRLF